ncbi:MAG TPA: hypothetical protein VIX35_07985, partial [Vicinamibacterales bacterium]
MFEPLPEDLARALSQAAPRLRAAAGLRFVSETGSTNDEALTLAQDDAPDGTAVIADAQRAGRGRRGRVWFSPPGSGVYLSVVVRVGPTPVTLSLVTLAAGVAAADAITAASG